MISRIQELSKDDSNEAGRIPRTLDIELLDDLVDAVSPGDIITVSGIVRAKTIEEGKGNTMHVLYLEAHFVTALKCEADEDSVDETNNSFSRFSDEDIKFFHSLAKKPNLFKILSSSLCPMIFGHEMVKAGLTLGLFGGRSKATASGSEINIRGEPHILVVGDPGLGKSQLLNAVANVAPRSVYVCGNTTTTAGLTVTMHHDTSSGDYALEAGALVLADQGVCCIDEFDKMIDHRSLLESMEQQSISIAKAGIVCSLPARTSIIAAANPIGGHYNERKTVCENLKMNPALLSRFDLVFILLDKANEEKDIHLSKHVMRSHTGIKFAPASSVLLDHLKHEQVDEAELISASMLRKYINYAKKNVVPRLTRPAAEEIQKFYLSLRNEHKWDDIVPITTRQLESMIRLTEARAKLELRSLATKEDALQVIELMKHSLFDYLKSDEAVNPNHSLRGTGKKANFKRFIAHLQSIHDRTGEDSFSLQQLKQEASNLKIEMTNFDEFLESLNHHGFLLKRAKGMYRLSTAVS